MPQDLITPEERKMRRRCLLVEGCLLSALSGLFLYLQLTHPARHYFAQIAALVVLFGLLGLGIWTLWCCVTRKEDDQFYDNLPRVIMKKRPTKTPLPAPVECPNSKHDQVPGAADL